MEKIGTIILVRDKKGNTNMFKKEEKNNLITFVLGSVAVLLTIISILFFYNDTVQKYESKINEVEKQYLAEIEELKVQYEKERDTFKRVVGRLENNEEFLSGTTYTDSIITYDEVRAIFEWDKEAAYNADAEYEVIETIRKYVPANIWNLFVQSDGQIILTDNLPPVEDGDALYTRRGQFNWYKIEFNDGDYFTYTITLNMETDCVAADVILHEFGHFALKYAQDHNISKCMTYGAEAYLAFKNLYKRDCAYFSQSPYYTNAIVSYDEFWAECFRVICKNEWNPTPSGQLKDEIDAWLLLGY